MAPSPDPTRTRPPLLLLALVLAAACARPASVAPSEPASAPPPGTHPAGAVELARANVGRAPASTEDARRAGAAVNDFAFDLYRALATEDENLVFSPASIAIALGMARAGARGDTAVQMDEVMHDLASDEHEGWLNSLDQALGTRSGSYEDATRDHQELTLEMANAWFGQRGYDFEPAFLEALANRFDAGVHLVDYLADAEGARRQINQWVSDRTRERIREVLAPGVVNEATRLALANAIYLKAPWDVPFNQEQTEVRAFRRLDGTSVDVPIMRSTVALPCATGNGWQAMDLAYVGRKLSMLVIIPEDLTAFEAQLDRDAIAEVDQALAGQDVDPDVALPRFDFESKADLVEVLSTLGMSDAFDLGRADFSGITTAEPLAIGAVVHQANISVDERGTEAAAATLVAFDTSGPPPTKCVAAADRPFLFAIRDGDTGAIIFMGRVVDPS
jgi:serpin B